MKTSIYGVVLSSTLATFTLVSFASAGTLIYEPFDYQAGVPIAGQGNWNAAGTAGSAVHSVVSPTLTSPSGFPAASGNAADLVNTDYTEFDRINIPNAFNPDNSPKYSLGSTLYWSALINVPSTAGLNQQHSNLNVNDGMIIAFNNSQGGSGTRPSVWAGELTIRLGSAPNTYNLGIRSSNTAAGTTYFTGDIAISGTHLVVASFAEGNGTLGDRTNGTNTVWVDPFSADYGGAAAPAGRNDRLWELERCDGKCGF